MPNPTSLLNLRSNLQTCNNTPPFLHRGINLYAMLTGQLPFHVEPINIAALHEKIMKGAKIPSHISPECQDLLSRLLVANEDERIDMKGLIEHPWINENCPKLTPYVRVPEFFCESALDSTALEDAMDPLSGQCSDHSSRAYLREARIGSGQCSDSGSKR
eukprot:sb/3472885/